ncbi:MAG: Fe-S cluster assembly ATPase SufC [Alphaproteobacteria bacterium]|nr:Fe-S cluster assembly ATPase SufC [Alphaproteobacteria bacterium]
MAELLKIEHLNVKVGNKEILKDLSLSIPEGQIHAIMGPNGCGKSTLSKVIVGDPAYVVTSGSITFKGKDLLKMSADERANEGVFLAFQHPVELPGVGMALLLKTAINAKRKYLGQEAMDAVQFMKHMKIRATALGITDEMLKRPVNVGFSGGEQKRLETFQMAMLEPDFCILDEMDSGLDVDALKVVGKAVSVMREAKRSFIIITHHDDLLKYVKPDAVSIMRRGTVVKTGGPELVKLIEEQGYDAIG